MSTTVATGNNTGLPDGTKIADDLIGTGTPPSSGDRVQYVKLDLGAAGLSVPVSGSIPIQDGGNSLTVDGSVSVSNFPVSQAVTGAFFQATQPVSLASAPTTAVTNAGLTNLDVALSTRLKPADTLAAVTAITNPVTANQGSANATPWNENIAQVGGAAVTLGAKVSASSIPVVVASDQGAFNVQHGLTGATNVMKTGTLTSVAVTADQVVLTYTVTAAKTFYLQYLVMYGRLTAVSATASILGAISLETPSGTKVITLDDVNPTTSECFQEVITFSEPQPIAAGVVVRVVVTPAATTSMLWRANFGGYEK